MERKINILEISSRSDIGGGPEQLFKIVANLKDRFRFYCACPDQQPYFDKIASLEIPLFELPHRRFKIKPFLRLLRWTRINRIMIVHSHGRGAGVYARLLGLFNRNLKVIHSFHGVHFSRWSFACLVEYFLSVLTDKFVLVSGSEQQSALSFRLASISKCALIENGILLDDGVLSEDQQSHVSGINGKAISPDSFVIGMLSRFDNIKNIPYAIVTLSAYLKSNDNVFLVIGGDGEERRLVEQTIEQHRLLDKVILLGYVQDIKQYFQLIDIYLNTSIGEAFGLSTVEAMKYGKPVVVSRVSGNIDIVDENKTGLFFQLDEPSTIIEKIEILRNDKEVYECLSRNALETVRKRFDLCRMLRKTGELYTSLIPDLSVSESVRVGINASKYFGVNTGVGRYTSNLCRSISEVKDGNDYYFYLPGRNSGSCGRYMNGFQPGKQGMFLQNNTLRILWEQILLPIRIRKDRLDLFHYTDHAMSLIQRMHPIVITVHDIAYIRFPDLLNKSRQIYKRYILNLSVKKADIIIADSHSTKRDIIEFFNVEEKKIKVVHLGVESRFRPVSNVEEYRLRNNLPAKMILNVGTLEPRKNVVALIRAFKELKGRGLKDYKLVIAGDKGWLYKRIFDEVKSNDLQKEVLFLGIVEDEDLPMLYNCANIFVYPSLYEGFGLPPLEAMACGIPVITSNTSSLPEVIGNAGIMVDPDDVNSLCEAMCNVLKDKELRCHMSKKGLERAKLFSWGETARKVLEIYDEVLLKNSLSQ